VRFAAREHRQSFDAAINRHYSTTLVGRRMVEESLLATCMKHGLFDMQRIYHVRRMKAIWCSNRGSLSQRDAIVVTSYAPQGDPPAGCFHCNCWLNKCRLIHCHHCHCCVRCRSCPNHHCRSICWDAMKHRMQQIIDYSGAIVFAAATVD
jgi:hypothetical protein